MFEKPSGASWVILSSQEFGPGPTKPKHIQALGPVSRGFALMSSGENLLGPQPSGDILSFPLQ